MTNAPSQSTDPSAAWAERIDYLKSLDDAEFIRHLLADVEAALSRIPEGEQRTSLVLQLLRACMAKRDAKAIIGTWRKAQMGKYPELRNVLKEYDADYYLKAKLFTFRIVSEMTASKSGTAT